MDIVNELCSNAKIGFVRKLLFTPEFSNFISMEVASKYKSKQGFDNIKRCVTNLELSLKDKPDELKLASLYLLILKLVEQTSNFNFCIRSDEELTKQPSPPSNAEVQ